MKRGSARRLQVFAGLAVLAVGVTAGRAAVSATPTVVADIDLSKPFHARSAWQFVAEQGPPAPDDMGDVTPARVAMCLRRTPGGGCDPALDALPDHQRPPSDPPWPPHFLQTAQLVYPRGGAAAPLLLVRTGSELSGDGDQVVATQILAYRPQTDRFERIYEHATGHNNNQEVRFVGSGPLRGDVIAIEPTEKAPFGFWVSVSALSPAYAYRQVLRYRSATHYGDGNPLAVIDSEMPNIEARLGLWRPGAPLPLPSGACPKPRLVAMELWCR
jgi:hypothetical protein